MTHFDSKVVTNIYFHLKKKKKQQQQEQQLTEPKLWNHSIYD